MDNSALSRVLSSAKSHAIRLRHPTQPNSTQLIKASLFWSPLIIFTILPYPEPLFQQNQSIISAPNSYKSTNIQKEKKSNISSHDSRHEKPSKYLFKKKKRNTLNKPRTTTKISMEKKKWENRIQFKPNKHWKPPKLKQTPNGQLKFKVPNDKSDKNSFVHPRITPKIKQNHQMGTSNSHLKIHKESWEIEPRNAQNRIQILQSEGGQGQEKFLNSPAGATNLRHRRTTEADGALWAAHPLYIERIIDPSTRLSRACSPLAGSCSERHVCSAYQIITTCSSLIGGERGKVSWGARGA